MPTPEAGEGGFTLVELLAVMVLFGLFAAFALPIRSGPSPTMQLRQVVRDMAAELRQGRGEAIAANRAVDVPLSPVLPVGAEMRLTTTAELAGQAAIRFAPDGSSTGGGAVLRLGEQGWQIDVDWLTGMVTVRELELELERSG